MFLSQLLRLLTESESESASEVLHCPYQKNGQENAPS